jgi:hypothetical protein
VHSDYVFTTMVSWQDYAHYRYAEVDGTVVITTAARGEQRFRPPVGPRKKAVFDRVMALARREGGSEFPFGVIDPPTRDWLAGVYPSITTTPHPDFFDYVYAAEDLAHLAGTAYRKIRNRLNKFTKTYRYAVEPIVEETVDEVQAFLRRWCVWRDCASDPLLESEKRAVFYSTDHFANLDLSGLAVRIDGEIEAIAIFERMNAHTVVVHYEKASADFDGIYQAISNETAQHVVREGLTFINRESDMGNSGLRRAKRSYRPHHMVEVYHVPRESLPAPGGKAGRNGR